MVYHATQLYYCHEQYIGLDAFIVEKVDQILLDAKAKELKVIEEGISSPERHLHKEAK